MAYKVIDNSDNIKVAEFRYLIDAAKFFLISYGRFRIEPADKDSFEFMHDSATEVLEIAFDNIRKPAVWVQR